MGVPVPAIQYVHVYLLAHVPAIQFVRVIRFVVLIYVHVTHIRVALPMVIHVPVILSVHAIAIHPAVVGVVDVDTGILANKFQKRTMKRKSILSN